jgi:hypothetical protein
LLLFSNLIHEIPHESEHLDLLKCDKKKKIKITKKTYEIQSFSSYAYNIKQHATYMNTVNKEMIRSAWRDPWSIYSNENWTPLDIFIRDTLINGHHEKRDSKGFWKTSTHALYKFPYQFLCGHWEIFRSSLYGSLRYEF